MDILPEKISTIGLLPDGAPHIQFNLRAPIFTKMI